jgi:hypothetical protein
LAKNPSKGGTPHKDNMQKTKKNLKEGKAEKILKLLVEFI